MTELSTSGQRPAGFARGTTSSVDDGAKVKRWGLIAIAVLLAIPLIAIIIGMMRKPTIEVTIGHYPSSIAHAINEQRGHSVNTMTEKQLRINYLDSIRVARACGLHAYMAGSDVPLTDQEARDAAKTTAWTRVNTPVYPGDVLSTRGGDHCREAPNTVPFDQR